jgi:hypothetical protein
MSMVYIFHFTEGDYWLGFQDDGAARAYAERQAGVLNVKRSHTKKLVWARRSAVSS